MEDACATNPAGGFAAIGCPSETGISDKEGDTGYHPTDDTPPVVDTGCPDNGCLVCTNGSCEVGVLIRTEEVLDCFWNYTIGDWIPSTPPEARVCIPGTDHEALDTP